MNTVKRLVSCLATIAFSITAYWAVRVAYADHLASGDGAHAAARAISLAPYNPRYWLRWADLKEQAGESVGSAFERAMTAGPYDAEVYIRAGLRAEMDGDNRRAERLLRQAAELSRQYQPRWTLANFYFRRGNREEFWRWTRSALDWAHGDRQPLFRLAWEMTGDADAILRRAIGPGSPALVAYLNFLLHTGRLDAAAACAPRVAVAAGPESRDVLLRFTEAALNGGRPEPALEAWNVLCGRRLIPYAPLDAAAGRVLTNGGFEELPLGQGFDWRLLEPGGVFFTASRRAGLLRIAFSGKQPERCEFLAQVMPVAPGRTYVLTFQYRTEDLARETGVAWSVSSAAGTEVTAGEPQQAAGEWHDGVLRFTAPAAARSLRLALRYRRLPGTTRVEGTYWLRQVSVEAE